MSKDLAELYKHNLWANLRLLDACATLTGDQLDLAAPGTYGSVRDTLLHLFGAEDRYVLRLKNLSPESPPREREAFPGIDQLRKSAIQTGNALIEIATTFETGSILRGLWRGEPYEIPAIILMIQPINHATEHRMHIVSILNQNGIETPDMDAWAYDDDMRK
jgi:uncharacterized damage-inducible protein DinB